MTVLVIYADTADDYITSEDSNGAASYTKARAGTGTGIAVQNDGHLYDGQFGASGSLYQCYEFFISFDTSVLAGQTIDAVVLSLYGFDNQATQAYTSEIWVKDWGTDVTTADFVAGASLAAQARVASFASAGMALEAYNNFTSDATFLANINKSGSTRLMGASSRMNAGNTPANGSPEYMGWYSADTAGTTKDPKLTVYIADPGPTRVGGKPRNFAAREADLFGGRKPKR